MDHSTAHRATTLRTIAQLAEIHNLPLPVSLQLFHHDNGTRHLQLRLDDKAPAAVRRWADVLALPMRTPVVLTTDGRDWFSVSATGGILTGDDTWHGWHLVKVWSSCDALTPADTAASDVPVAA